MQDKITLAIDALASAAFIEGGVSPENTQAARDLTEQRKRELVEAIGAPCLHQIQEPAPVLAAPDERVAFEKWASFVGHSIKRWPNDVNLYEDNATEEAWIAWQARAALAATPAAALVDKSTELQGSQVDKTVILQDSSPVPVVLPEPFALYDGEKWYANEEAAICSCADMAKLQKVFIESQLLTLLAGVSAPAAQARSKSGWTFEELEAQLAEATKADPENCRAVGEELLKVIHENFTALKAAGWDGPADSPVEVVAALLNLLEEANSAAPQALADARDVLTLAELMQVRSALDEISDFGETKVAYSLLLRAANLNYLDCAQFVGFEAGTFALDAAIATAKGE